MNKVEFYMRVHLTNGKSVDSHFQEITEDQLEDFQNGMKQVLMSSDGWQVNIKNGLSWCCFPKQSVLYVETIRVT